MTIYSESGYINCFFYLKSYIVRLWFDFKCGRISLMDYGSCTAVELNYKVPVHLNHSLFADVVALTEDRPVSPRLSDRGVVEKRVKEVLENIQCTVARLSSILSNYSYEFR